MGRFLPAGMPTARYLGEVALLAALYAIVGKLGLMADAVSGYATLLWPPSGIALAALLLRGKGLWPGVMVGAFVANAWSGAPVVAAGAIAVGNTLEALIGTLGLRRLGFCNSLTRVRDVLALAGVAALLSTLLSSTIGVMSLSGAGLVPAGSAALTWRAWWLGDMASDLLVAPLLLTQWTKPLAVLDLGRIAEAALLALAIAVTCLVVFGGLPIGVPAFESAYYFFPPAIWAALRFDQRGVAAATLLATAGAVIGTSLGLGPFAGGALHDSLMSLQVFLVVLAVTALVLGAASAERGQAARDSRESDARLRLAQQAARIGSFDWNIRTGLNLWTAELEAIHGLAPGAFARSRQAWEELVHPEDRGDFLHLVRHALATGAPVEGEWRIVRPDGTIRWVAGRWGVYRDESGQPLRMTGINIDITERKRAEETQERLAAIVESTDDAIIAKDLDGVIRTWNSGAVRLLGYSAQEAIGRSVRMLLPPERQQEEDEILSRLRAGQRIEHLDSVRQAKDGRLIDVSVTVSPLHDASGKVIGAAKIVHDITERKRAEEALREADRRKDEFLGILSHELRNPLAPIRNSLFILDHADPSSAQARHAREVVNRQVLHLSRLVDDLLDVTRIARGKIQLQRTELDLAALVGRAAEDNRGLLADRGLELVVHVPQAPVLVNGDDTRLAQVLGNLLQNAAKFTPEGGRVTVWLEGAGGHAELHVRDTGVGIEPALLKAVFEPFTQAEQNLARTSGGLGLGLALVRGLVELHGGSVVAYSEGQSRGTEIVVRLPLARESPARQRRAGAVGTGTVRRQRVLVVDDNRDAADSLAALVEVLGHDAEVVYDATTALARARAHPPDVILCDIGLPGMDGYGVARELRRSGLGRIRLVAVTGYARPEDIQRAAEAGFEGHVAKPPDPENIQRVLQ